MIRRPPRSTLDRSSAASDVYKRQFQANGGWDLLAWVLYNNVDDSSSKMEPIDDTAIAQGWLDVMPQAVLDAVTFKKRIYGVPLNIHRVNTVFFNQKVFTAGEVPVPSSLDEVFVAAAAFRERGIAAPIALGTKDGTLPLLFFENLLVARAGGPYYQTVSYTHLRAHETPEH